MGLINGAMIEKKNKFYLRYFQYLKKLLDDKKNIKILGNIKKKNSRM